LIAVQFCDKIGAKGGKSVISDTWQVVSKIHKNDSVILSVGHITDLSKDNNIIYACSTFKFLLITDHLPLITINNPFYHFNKSALQNYHFN